MCALAGKSYLWLFKFPVLASGVRKWVGKFDGKQITVGTARKGGGEFVGIKLLNTKFLDIAWFILCAAPMD